jgi:hypothetical protein
MVFFLLSLVAFLFFLRLSIFMEEDIFIPGKGW